MPPLLLPRKGRFGLIDYEKAFTADIKNGPDIFVLRGVDRANGALVVVRPDQHVANVLPLDVHDELANFDAAVVLGRRPPLQNNLEVEAANRRPIGKQSGQAPMVVRLILIVLDRRRL